MVAKRNSKAKIGDHYTPDFIPKWRKIHLLFCIRVNWPFLPRFEPNIPLNSADGIKATRAN